MNRLLWICIFILVSDQSNFAAICKVTIMVTEQQELWSFIIRNDITKQTGHLVWDFTLHNVEINKDL